MSIEEVMAQESQGQKQGEDTQNKEVTIDWGKVEIPEEVVREHPAYKNLLDESISRRKTIRELEAKLTPAEEETEEEEAEIEVGEEPDLEGNLAKLLQSFEKQVSTRIASLEQQLQEREAMTLKQQLQQKYNLTEDDMDLVHGADAAEMERRAKRVAELNNRPSGDGGEGGNSDTSPEELRVRRILEAALKTGQADNIWGVDTQRKAGGHFG